MSHVLRNCGLVTLVVCTIGVSCSETQAGNWRRTCYYQPAYYGNAWNPMPAAGIAAPVAAPTDVAAVDGRYRYRSGYQAPVVAPEPVVTPVRSVYVAPVDSYYYHDAASQPDRPIHFENRTFEEQNRADRKIRGL